MLTTLANCRAVPGLQNVIKITDGWLNALIAAADATIKDRTKQNLELTAIAEYQNGNEQTELVLKQFPVWCGVTQIASGSNGAVLPQSTINVVSTLGADGTSAFDPGGRSSGQNPVVQLQTGLTTWTTVSYTGLTSTSFTGCIGGVGTLSSVSGQNAVSQPVVYIDPTGNGSQTPVGATPYPAGVGPFGPQTIQALGVNFQVETDDNSGSKSRRGLLRRVGGYMSADGWIGSYPYGGYGQRGKLSAERLPTWPRGYGNVKVQYSAGYQTVPLDLQFCCTTLVAAMVRNQPKGVELASEGLGAYSYSVLQSADDPEIASVRQILSRYTDVAW